MTRREIFGLGVRDIIRWWPLILVPAVIAVAAAIWSVNHQRPMYTASTRMVVVPLTQWDETFLGTSLIRDAGDPKRTAPTVAALLNTRKAATTAAAYLGNGWTPESVDDAVKVTVVQDTNAIDIVAKATEPERAARLAEGFATATLRDRWRTISGELDARIAAISKSKRERGDAASRLEVLSAARQAGADPTLRIESNNPAVPVSRPSVVVVVGVALAGGLFIGVLAAMGMARLRQRSPDGVDAVAVDEQQNEPVYSPNGGS